MMNLTKFLSRVDTAMAGMAEEELQDFIHGYARVLPEDKRDNFLKRLLKAGVEPGTGQSGKQAEGSDKELIREEISQIRGNLCRIENGELCLVGNLNEEYDDWYDSMSDEFIFEDPDKVGKLIEEACGLVHKCVDHEMYAEGYALADNILLLTIQVNGDYYDNGGAELSLNDSEVRNLNNADYRQLILDMLLSAYRTLPADERPDELYRIICGANRNDITLEALIQEGKEELEGLNEFMDLWISYLGLQKSRWAETLLAEALALCGNMEKSIKAARMFSKEHPSLYEYILKQNLDSGNEEKLALGLEALGAVPARYVIRSRIALLTAVHALRLGQRETAEMCWLEAFQSNTEPVQYLRLAVESVDFSKYREQAGNIYKKVYADARKTGGYLHQAGELSENGMDDRTYYMLAFLNGDFDTVMNDGMAEKEPLGWSYTFMKCGVAAFLLYLYQGKDMQAGCRYMCGILVQTISFTVEKYSQGLDQPLKSNDMLLFWECFCKWKAMTPMPETLQEELLQRLENWIQMRIEDIMDGSHRKYYGECAAFIAGLGEVRQSRGELNAKSKMMESFKKAYSRRSAFHKELREFGMKDKKK